MSGSGGETRGVSVEVGDVEAAVDLTVAVDYGKPIPRVAEAARNNVVNRVENLVGLRITEVNITVGDGVFPEEGEEQRELQGSQEGTRAR